MPMKRIVITLLVVAMMAFAGAGTTLASPPTDGPPGQGECSHGNSQATCRPDPQPDHGQDCDEHGPFEGGVNEDHCGGETSTPSPSSSPTPTAFPTPSVYPSESPDSSETPTLEPSAKPTPVTGRKGLPPTDTLLASRTVDTGKFALGALFTLLGAGLVLAALGGLYRRRR